MKPRFAVAAVVAASLMASACAGGRSTLNTGASSCFRSIGTAAAAAGEHGRVLGVVHRRGTKLQSLFPEDQLPATRLCVVGFVRRPQPGTVVVIVDPHRERVLGVHRVDRSPIRFTNLH